MHKPVLSRARLLLLGLLLLGITACSLLPAKGLPDLVQVAGLPASEQLELRWREHSFSFLLIQQMQAGPDRLQVVATTLTGQQLFELAYDGKRVKVLQRVAEMQRLPVDYLLRDILWASWPLASVQSGIRPYGYQVQEQALEQGLLSRQISANGKLILDVQRRADGVLHVENRQAGYVVDITPLE